MILSLDSGRELSIDFNGTIMRIDGIGVIEMLEQEGEFGVEVIDLSLDEIEQITDWMTWESKGGYGD